MKMKCIRINANDLKKWQNELQNLEAQFTYPWGNDSFQIDHGDNYFKFFERIGNLHYYACTLDDKIIGVGAGIIHHRLKSWYLCDMKVHPDFRGHKITLKLFKRFFLPCFLKCQKGFALTMEGEKGNPIMKIMQNLPWTPLKVGSRLHFYLEEQEKMNEALSVLSEVKSNIHFTSLNGIKDLVLKSSNQAMPLLHLEWGENSLGSTFEKSQKNAVHMFQLPEGHPSIVKLESLHISPKASGLIFQHGLKKMDWSELRTSEL